MFLQQCVASLQRVVAILTGCLVHFTKKGWGGSCWLRAQGFFQALLTLDFAFSEQKQYKNPNEERKAAKVSEVIEMSFGLETLVG